MHGLGVGRWIWRFRRDQRGHQPECGHGWRCPVHGRVEWLGEFIRHLYFDVSTDFFHNIHEPFHHVQHLPDEWHDPFFHLFHRPHHKLLINGSG